MGHANTSCLISGLSIGHRKVLCTILAPTNHDLRISNSLLSENQLFYPLTMPFVGQYSADELSLESYEKNEWIDNLVDYFRSGVKKNKQKDFDALALLQCIRDRRDDSMGDRAIWFDINNPNELCQLTKTLNVAYIDFEVFEELEKKADETEFNAVFRRHLENTSIRLQMIDEQRIRKSKTIYWEMFHLEQVSHDLFLKINEQVLRDLLGGKKKVKLDGYVQPLRDLLTVSWWLFNLGRPWTPATSSHQDGEDENISTLAKIIIKINKKREC